MDHKPPTVLIADDSDIVSDFLENTFRAYGYRTLTAASKDQVTEHCQREGSAIRVLVADVRLGMQDDFETVRLLTAMSPETKVILISGYPLEHLEREGLLPAGQQFAFLQKPFPPLQIMDLLKSLQKCQVACA
jgi:two-component system cell cycle sensor histidine kinase/response regulator CckA